MSDTVTASTPAPAPATTPAAEPTAPVAQPAEQPAAAAADAAPAKGAPGDFLAPKFAALARKDKELRAAQAALAAKESDYATRAAELEAHRKAKTTWRDDPIAAIESLGITVEDLATAIEKGPPADKTPQTPEQKALAALQAQLEELRKEREAERAASNERRRADAEAAYKQRIAEHVKTNAEKYELVAERKMEDMVFEVIKQYYSKTEREAAERGEKDPRGVELDLDTAADWVEQHLTKEAEGWLGSKAKKLQALLQRAGVPAAQAAAAATAAVQPSATAAPAAAAEDTEPDTVEAWLAAAEANTAKNATMRLTNDTAANLPSRRVTADDGDALQRAIEQLQFTK